MKSWFRKHKTSLLIFLILILSYSYFMPRWASWSQNSRINLVMAIVDELSIRIDKFCLDQGGLKDEEGNPISECENTGDYAKYNGHFYSDKAPGVAFLGVVPYALFKGAASLSPIQGVLERLAQSSAFEATLNEEGSGLLIEKIYYALALYTVTIAIIAIPAALLGVLIYNTLGLLGLSNPTRFWTTLIYGLATPAFAYGGMLFSHQLVAFLVFFAFYQAFRFQKGAIDRKNLFVAGFALGWSVITEYPSVLIAAGVTIYILYRHFNWEKIVWLVIGGIIPGVLLMAYDYAAFGTILPVGYQYSVLYTQEGGAHSSGFLSLTYPHFEALWGITFGSFRGLFFLSPILLLAIGGFPIWWSIKSLRSEWFLSVWAVSSFLLFNGSSVMWQGGYAVGPRYLIPMLPFLVLSIGFAWEKLAIKLYGRLLLVLLTLWSITAIWLETISGQSFPDWTRNPLFNYSLPKFIAGDIARNIGMVLGLRAQLSLFPLLIILAILIYLFYQSSINNSNSSLLQE